MKIACLQFAPQVGDTNNNLNRADAVLNKALDVEDIDLLVLPELAFTGYNFHSLAHISPHLEPSVSGISSLWARTTALKFNCNIIVGYPEKVDVSQQWPANLEFYNAAVIVGRDGETLGNYRKSFLYAVDETWALEGQDGFYAADIQDLGHLALGICMDLNPYKFEAPWDAFEFAHHILDVRANLVVISMAWLTREDASTFTQHPHEPDMATLEYWIQRLEPVIRESGKMNTNSRDEEVIVVFCNRVGIEEDAVYAGTSAVVGVHNGEVNLYGILGRDVKDLLVVDTSLRPFAKLVQSNPPVNRGEKHQQQQPQQEDRAGDEAQQHQYAPPYEPTAPSSSIDRTMQRSKDGGGGRERVPGGDGSLSPISMFNFPPSSPKRTFGVNNGVYGSRASSNSNFNDNNNRINQRNHENINNTNNNTNRFSNEFISPMSTEAGWQRWEQASGAGLLNVPGVDTEPNSAVSVAGSALNRRSQSWLADSRPALPALELQVFDGDRRNSIGAFRDAVGSPPAGDGDVDEGFLAAARAAAKESKLERIPSTRQRHDRSGPLTGGSNRSGSSNRQRNSDRHEKKKTDKQLKTKSPDKKPFSPPPMSREASRHNDLDRHANHESSTPNFFDEMFQPASAEDEVSLGLYHSRSTESWGSMTGNSSASSDAGRHHDDHPPKSAHPGHGGGYEDFQNFYHQNQQQQQARFSPSSTHMDLGRAEEAEDRHQEPEQYYTSHSNEQRYGNNDGGDHYEDYNDSEKEATYQYSDRAGNGKEEAESYTDDERQYSNNKAVMSEFMQLLQPHQKQQKEKPRSSPSPPVQSVPTSTTPMRPTSTKSRNTSRPRPSDVSTPLRSASKVGSRLSRSTSQPQMNVPLIFTPRNLFQEERQQQKQQQEQQRPPQKRQPSRNSSTQRVADAAIYFRPDSNLGSSRAERNQSKGRFQEPVPGSELGHRQQESETRTGRSSSASITPRKNDSAAGVSSMVTRPSNRGRQPTSTPAAEIAVTSTPNNRHTSARGKGRTGARVAGNNEPGRLPSTASPFTSNILANTNASSNAAGMATIGHERAASAMSFMSGTSFASTAMATESWLASTPAPPVMHQLQQQLQQQQPRSASASARPANPDNEIIAMISLVKRGCPVHSGHGHESDGHHHGHSQTPDAAEGQRPAGSAPPSRDRPRQLLLKQQQHRRSASSTAATATSGAAPTDNGSNAAQGDNIYEVLLPPHIRDLVESLSNPMENHALRHRQVAPASPMRGGTAAELRNSRGTPIFNPPTPTAMQFNSEAVSPATAVAATEAAAVVAADTATVEMPKAAEPAVAAAAVAADTAAVEMLKAADPAVAV